MSPLRMARLKEQMDSPVAQHPCCHPGPGPQSGTAVRDLLVGLSQRSERGGIFFRLIFLIFLIAFCFLTYIARNPLLRVAGGLWVVDQAPVQSDAIILLGDDNYFGDRADRAAEMYRAKWAPVVVASGRMLRPYASIAELMEHDLKEKGVPESAIVLLAGRISNTREEAESIANVIRQRGWKKVLLVTSNYHTRRARYIAERIYPPGTEVRMIAAPDSDYNPDNWWKTRAGEKIFFMETFGMLEAMWELRGHPVVASDSGGTFTSFRD